MRLKGSAENCEAAKQALLDLTPITIEVEVPFKFHRFIIGQRGQSVRALMNTHDVNIQVCYSQDNCMRIPLLLQVLTIHADKSYHYIMRL